MLRLQGCTHKCFHYFSKGNFGRKKNHHLNLSDHEKVKENTFVLKKVNLIYRMEAINESAKANIV